FAANLKAAEGCIGNIGKSGDAARVIRIRRRPVRTQVLQAMQTSEVHFKSGLDGGGNLRPRDGGRGKTLRQRLVAGDQKRGIFPVVELGFVGGHGWTSSSCRSRSTARCHNLRAALGDFSSIRPISSKERSSR